MKFLLLVCEVCERYGWDIIEVFFVFFLWGLLEVLVLDIY